MLHQMTSITPVNVMKRVSELGNIHIDRKWMNKNFVITLAKLNHTRFTLVGTDLFPVIGKGTDVVDRFNAFIESVVS